MNKYNFQLTENTSIYLNLIRIIAIQMVVIGHGIGFMGIATFLHYPNFPWIQNIGVVIFFLLSGFLISYSSFKKTREPMYTFKEYYIERFSRIYIAYIPVLLIIVILDAILFLYLRVPNIRNSYNIETFIFNLFMLQDANPLIGGYTSFGSARILWTLPMFWGLYMLFGWLILGNRTVNNKVLYTFILMLLIFFIILIGTGPRGDIKFRLLIIWIIGAVIALLLNLNANNLNEDLLNQRGNNQTNFYHRLLIKLKLFLKWFLTNSKLCLALSFLFLVLASIRVYSTKQAYDISFGLCLAATFFFLLSLPINHSLKFQKKSKKLFIYWLAILLHFICYTIQYLRFYQLL